MDKTKQVWYLYANNKKALQSECVSIVSQAYIELGQKPTAETIALMGTLLADDLAHNYGRLELDEVRFAISKGIRNGDEGTSCFINVRTWNVWLRDYKKAEMLRKQQGLITDYQAHTENVKRIGNTVKKAKQLNNGNKKN